MRIVVLGGEGMLGHKMFHTLRARYPDTITTVSGLLDRARYARIGLFQSGGLLEGVNAFDFPALRVTLAELRPDVIVNCIGVVKQRADAVAPIPSIGINALLPHLLADWADAWSGHVIHFSTDCVFSGKRGLYREDDPSDAADLYGRTKYLGEVRMENALTLRTSIIGRELKHFASLLEWFLRNESSSVRGFTNAIFSGVTTNQLSRVVRWLIESYPQLSGLYQVASSPISKYNLLLKLRDAFSMSTGIVPDAENVCDRSLSGERFRQATGYQSPSWDELVTDLANDPVPYEDLR